MSDRETIIQTLIDVQSRIRTNAVIERLGHGFSILSVIGLVAWIVYIALPVSPAVRIGFWALWFAAMAVWLVRSFSLQRDLIVAATEVDRQSQLQDEILSAHWFLGQGKTNPWVDLHVHRAAERIERLDVKKLWPRIVPRTSYLGVVGMALLLGLNFVPGLLANSLPVRDLLSRNLLPPVLEDLLGSETIAEAPDAPAEATDPTDDRPPFRRVSGEEVTPSLGRPGEVQTRTASGRDLEGRSSGPLGADQSGMPPPEEIEFGGAPPEGTEGFAAEVPFEQPGDFFGAPQQGGLELGNAVGDMLSNSGFSPNQREGPATSLDVLLEQERLEVEIRENAGDNTSRQAIGGQEFSSLDYQDVASDLGPAEQRVLTETPIPRGYRDLIKEYFQAIRPSDEP